MTIAVTAASGQLGRLAITAFKVRGAAPVALARSPERQPILESKYAISTMRRPIHRRFMASACSS